MLPTRLRQPGRQAPLPDVVAVRRLAVPDPAPPYDDEVAEAGQQQPDHDAADRRCADLETGDTGTADTGTASTCASDPHSAAHGHGPSSGGSPRRDPAAESLRPDPADAWPSQFAQVLAETLAGSRPAQQLTPWTTEQARRRIRQLGPMLATDQRPRVRRVMTSVPADGVLELTAVVGFGPRVRALAFRLEHEQARPYRQGGSRWCCTAIESA